jgi:hypothetical protein
MSRYFFVEFEKGSPVSIREIPNIPGMVQETGLIYTVTPPSNPGDNGNLTVQYWGMIPSQAQEDRAQEMLHEHLRKNP